MDDFAFQAAEGPTEELGGFHQDFITLPWSSARHQNLLSHEPPSRGSGKTWILP
jgi:hypothetical protein